MMKYVSYLFIFLCIACGENNESESFNNKDQTNLDVVIQESLSDINLREYSVSEDEIRSGFVKEIEVNDSKGTSIQYKLIKSISDSTFLKEEYDSNFDLLTSSKFRIEENSYVQYEYGTTNENGDFLKFDITKPLIISFDNKDTVSLSEFSYLDENDEIVYQELLEKLKGLETSFFKGDSIACIRKDFSISVNTESNSSASELLSIPVVEGYRLEAIGIGVIYHSITYSDNTTTTSRLLEIMTLEEFEKLKTNQVNH